MCTRAQLAEKHGLPVGRLGKRNAVRNKSGKSVDHSDPGLRVGPTLSPTADRKSAASPISQRKSGREREGGALAISSGEAAAPDAKLTSEDLTRLRELIFLLDNWDQERKLGPRM